MQYPSLTKRTYSMGCDYCAARYLRDNADGVVRREGFDDEEVRSAPDITKWTVYGVDEKRAYLLKAEGVFIDPELKQRKNK
jgi:hypothetical protein